MNAKHACIVLMILAIGTSVSANPFTAPEGLGDMTSVGTGRAAATGGAGIARADGATLLLDNPALTSAVTSPTLFVGAGFDRTTTFTGGYGGSDSPTAARLDPNVFRLFLPPMKNVVIGWSLTPLTKSDGMIAFAPAQDGLTDRLESSGGLSVSAASLGVNVRDVVRLGVSFNYTFGVMREDWQRTLADSLSNPSLHVITKNYKGYSTSLGTVVAVPGGFFVGAGYTTATDLDASFHVRQGWSTNLPETTLPTVTRKLPSRWTLGFTTPSYRRMTLSMDYSAAAWEKAAVTPTEKTFYTDTYAIKGGVSLLPGPRPELARSYLERMSFFAGARYGTQFRKSYPKVGTVAERAVSIGAQFPFSDTNGGVLTSFEYGTRGDKSKNGWDETFMTFNVLLIGAIK